jgi:N-acetylmuramoyl-L-alanine amidase
MQHFLKPIFVFSRLISAGFFGLWLLVALPAQGAGFWDVRKHDGEDYVSTESIKQYPGYKFKTMTRKGNEITLESPGDKGVVMKLVIGSAECTMNRVKFVFCKPVVEINSKAFISCTDLAKLVHPVLTPSFIKNAGNFNTVILDPGHGGKDPGATNAYGTEAGYNLLVANLAKAELMKLGFKVVMTRTTDHYLTLEERVNLANAVKGEAVFISIHFNSGGRAARGIETFTLSPPGVAHYGRGVVAADSFLRAGNEHDSANVALATATHGMVTRSLEGYTFDRGIKRARYTVLSGVRHPAILLEGGFMSHPYESRLIHKPEYQARVARAVAQAVKKYQVAVTRRPTAASN